MAETPFQLGPYDVHREIGRGGMGVVYLARDRRLDRDVAIKALSAAMAREPDRLERFRREARIIAQLDHPNIVGVHQLLESEGQVYLVLEFVPGRALNEHLARNGPLDFEEAIGLCIQVARAVEAAHARGVIHRDLKPANVRIRPDGTAKVLDFGLARTLVRSERSTTAAPEPEHPPRMSRRAGTPGYMAPEQARGEAVDARSDVFAFGCLLFECLADRAAFTGETVETLIRASIEDEPDWTKLTDRAGDALRAVLRGCLSKQPDARPASIADVRADLEAELARGGSDPGPAVCRVPPLPIPGNLPLATTLFVGRDHQLAELARLVADNRLVTVTGPGGCGKSRVAIELARRMAATEFPDGAYLVELAPVSDSSLVASTVVATLKIPDQRGTPTLDVLRNHLAERNLLLVLDNCEHVLDATAQLVAHLLDSTAGLRIVATSREALGMPGERAWPLRGLAIPASSSLRDVAASEAAILFTERARAIRPGFELDETNAPAISRLCRRLEGLPLAVELAAARTGTLAPQEIDDRLDDEFRLLDAPARGRPERHQSLRATVDWSYRMLCESEKRMFRVLSIFVGTWSLESAIAVCGPGGDVEGNGDLEDFGVLDLLGRLVSKSLVVASDADGHMRYRMLATVRHFALEALSEEDERTSAAQGHLAYFLALVERAEPHLVDAAQAHWLIALEAEHDEILAALGRCGELPDGPTTALRICAALSRFWLVRGHFRAGVRACEAALARPGAEACSAPRAGTHQAAAVLALALGEYERARSFGGAALELAEALDDNLLCARALNTLGNAAYYQGDLDEAERRHTACLTRYRTLDRVPGLAASLNNLANIVHDQGRLHEARDLYEEALDLNRTVGHRASEAINLNNLGLILGRQGERDAARDMHERSLAIRRDLGDRHGIAESLDQLARLGSTDGSGAAGRRLEAESLAIRRDVDDRLGIADSLDGAAQLASRAGEHERAARTLGASEQLRSTLGAPRPVPEQADLESALAPTRDVLGEATFERLVTAGMQVRFDTSLDEVQSWLEAEPAWQDVPTRLA